MRMAVRKLLFEVERIQFDNAGREQGCQLFEGSSIHDVSQVRMAALHCCPSS
jgi:hypothetical protein